MAVPILTAASLARCPHGGGVATAPMAPRVLVGGVPVLTEGSIGMVQGCPLPAPGPCVSAQWQGGAVRVLAAGRPVLLQSSSGLCLSAAGVPAGPATIAAAQPRVLAV